MRFRQATTLDILNVIDIIKKAQVSLKEQGIDQWQNNYPNVETITNDVKEKYGYVLEDNGKILGYVALIFDGEKTYQTIYHGKWSNDEEYVTIHRIVVDAEHKRLGLSSTMFREIENLSLDQGINTIRVDTHRDNIPMQSSLNKNGFKYCGIIYLKDGNERMAFDKEL